MTDNTTLYQRLGVAQTATVDEIKTAYRTAAKTCHPDNDQSDGAASRFNDLNDAFNILVDPERRARYDRTGIEDENAYTQQILAEAHSLIVSTFMSLIEKIPDPTKVNPFHHIRNALTARIADLNNSIPNTERERLRFSLIRQRVSTKHTNNLVHVAIDQKIAAIDTLLRTSYKSIAVNESALMILDQYEYRVDVDLFRIDYTSPSVNPKGSFGGRQG